MKNNELTEVKPVMPSLEGLPQEVIEYVLGLVAENAALRVVVDGVNSELYGQGFDVLGWHLNGETEPLDNWFTDNGWGTPETPVTDAAIAEIKAQGVDGFADHMQSEKPFWEPEDWAMMDLAAEEAYKFAANLRAGRKG